MIFIGFVFLLGKHFSKKKQCFKTIILLIINENKRTICLAFQSLFIVLMPTVIDVLDLQKQKLLASTAVISSSDFLFSL
jgi:hypothetical protein